MKLIRFGAAGRENPGVELPDATRLDVRAFGEDYDEKFFETDGIARLRKWLSANEAIAPRVAATERLGPPIARPSKIICIGLNFRDHAREQGVDLPKEPVLFFKATTSLCGPNDNLIIPKGSVKTDWEVELAVIIGKRASYISREEAFSHVAGYALHNDYSEREFQIERGGQWVKGKSCDTFAPLGPYLVTPDEIKDVHALPMWLKINGNSKQDSNTGEMANRVDFLISYISQFMTLLPGDVISTGTPAGVGLCQKPPQFLKAGDVIELGIGSLGTSRQHAVPYRSNS